MSSVAPICPVADLWNVCLWLPRGFIGLRTLDAIQGHAARNFSESYGELRDKTVSPMLRGVWLEVGKAKRRL